MRLLVLLPLLALTTLSVGCIQDKIVKAIKLPPRRPSPEIVLSQPAQTHPGRWVLIDERLDSLTVKDGDTTLAQFDNVAFGVAGVGLKKRQGDGVTPQGSFKIYEIRPSSRFHIFAALNYPTAPYVELGHKNHLIPHYEFHQLLDRINRGLVPPQTTRLGGNIGIHGVGRGDLETHRAVNWTDGCIAVENEQMERLITMVSRGTPVEITKG